MTPSMQILDMIAALESTTAEARALALATTAHCTQVRKYTGQPYADHLFEVYREICALPGSTSAQRQAAPLHDIVEEVAFTGVSHADVHRWFEDDVYELVWWLTDVSTAKDGNRAARKHIDLKHIAAAPAAAQDVKLADVLSNIRTVVRSDPSFAAVYLPEKYRVVEALERADPVFRNHVFDAVKHEMAKLTSLHAFSMKP